MKIDMLIKVPKKYQKGKISKALNMYRNSLNMKEIYQMAIFGEFQVIKFQEKVFLELGDMLELTGLNWLFERRVFERKNVISNRLRGTPIHQNIQAEI